MFGTPCDTSLGYLLYKEYIETMEDTKEDSIEKEAQAIPLPWPLLLQEKNVHGIEVTNSHKHANYKIQAWTRHP
jgi:hypothetical protein